MLVLVIYVLRKYVHDLPIEVFIDTPKLAIESSHNTELTNLIQL